MELSEKVIKYYESVFGYTTGNRAFEFKPSKTQCKQIDNFIKLLDEEVGIESIDGDFIFYFICFQYERKKDQKSKFGFGKLPLNNVIGQKAFDRWMRKPGNWKFWVDKFISDYNIPKPTREVYHSTETGISHHEEIIKKRFWGTGELFFHCSNMTSLYNESSEFCVKCKYKGECEILKGDL